MPLLRRIVRFLMGVVVLGVLVANSRPVFADQFNFTVFAYPGASLTFAQGINNNGDIFGITGEPFETGFLYQNGSYGLFPGIVDVNDLGMVLVNTSSGPGIFFHGNFTPLSVPGSVIAFNNTGTVLVSGGYVKNGVFYPVSYPGAASTILRGINDLDEIVGSYNGSHGFLYKDGAYTPIDFPGAITSGANAINNNGEIAGNYFVSNEIVGALGIQGFIYQDGNYETFDAFNFHSPETATEPTGINDFGVITGIQFDGPNGAYASFVATPVPEPGTLGLLGIGLMMTAGAVRQHLGRK